MNTYTLKVTSTQSSARLDMFILAFTQTRKMGLSRAFIQKLILEGFVELNGQAVRKPHHKVKTQDAYRVSIPERKILAAAPEDIRLEVVYEDRDLAVINKPAGLVVHPAPGNSEHTLVAEPF